MTSGHKTDEKDNRIGEMLLRGLLACFGALPLCVHHFNARWISFLIRKVFRYRTALVESNLSHAFPGKSPEEIKDIFRKFYLHFAEVFVEAVWFGGCRKVKRLLDSRIVESRNPQELIRLYKEKPSVVVVCSHAGNWELYGGMPFYNVTDSGDSIPVQNYRMSYLRQSSRVWDRILRDNRLAPLEDRDGFEGYIESRSLARDVITHRNDKMVFNFINDQRPYFNAPDYIMVNFMNRECRTMSAAAALASKFSLPVLYLRMMHKEDGRGYYIEHVTITEDASKMAVEDIIKQYYRLLEADIRQQPENYLWTHNRWG